jgi:hypothetical protein
LPQHDAQIFDEVVAVDFNITGRFDLQIETAVLAPLFEHVLPKRQAGLRGQINFKDALPVQIQSQFNLRFGGVANDFRLAFRGHEYSLCDGLQIL